MRTNKFTAWILSALSVVAVSCSDKWDDHYDVRDITSASADIEVYSGDVVSYLKSQPTLSEITGLFEKTGIMETLPADGQYTLVVCENDNLDMSKIENDTAFVKNSNETVSPQADAEDVLYASTGDGNVYRSTDGISWNLVEALSGNVETLISSFQGQLIGRLGHEGNSYLVTAQEGNTAWPAIDSNTPTVPEEFPTENIYSTEFQTANMLDEIMIVGKTTGEKIIPWAYDGHNWAQMDPGTSYDSYCLTANIGYYPSIIYYGGQFYITGERLQNFYKSDAGLAWYKTESMFLLPKDVELRGNYSLAVDNDNFIWLVIGQSSGTPNEVWRGRLNRLGFKQQ